MMNYPDPDAPYYRLYRAADGKIKAVCMQWFDEGDYDESRFFTDTKYDTEEEALAANPYKDDTWAHVVPPSIFGRQRALADSLTAFLHRKTVEPRSRLFEGQTVETTDFRGTARGNYFEIRVDGNQVLRVTVEFNRVDPS